MSWMNLAEFRALCIANEIEVPSVVTRAIDLMGEAEALLEEPRLLVLELTPDQVNDYVRDLSLRDHQSSATSRHGLRHGVYEFREQVWADARAELLPVLDDMVVQLRPRFDEAVAPIVEGVTRHGFTYRTTSDEVINAGDADAMLAWSHVGKAWNEVRPIAKLRSKISELFTVSPTHVESSSFGRPELRNWSVCFAAGEQWDFDSRFHIEDRPSLAGLDWFAIAQGGLRLNTPTEVRAKVVERAQKQDVRLKGARPTDLAALGQRDPDEMPHYGKPIQAGGA